MTVRSFTRFIREESDRMYTLDLSRTTSERDIDIAVIRLIPYIQNLNKKSRVRITIEPLPEEE